MEKTKFANRLDAIIKNPNTESKFRDKLKEKMSNLDKSVIK